jgi:hypothetical protein
MVVCQQHPDETQIHLLPLEIPLRELSQAFNDTYNSIRSENPAKAASHSHPPFQMPAKTVLLNLLAARQSFQIW